MAYVKDRDDATLADIERYEWRKKWSRYIRVHNAEFVNGTLENGVSLNELMDNLKANSFNSTQRNAVLGEGNTNPRRAYRQQAAVELSAEGFSWLAERLQAAFEAHGKVPLDSIEDIEPAGSLGHSFIIELTPTCLTSGDREAGNGQTQCAFSQKPARFTTP